MLFDNQIELKRNYFLKIQNPWIYIDHNQLKELEEYCSLWKRYDQKEEMQAVYPDQRI